MKAQTGALLIIAVLFLPSHTTGIKTVQNCDCQSDGNEYIQLAEENCEKFTQYDNHTKLTHTHSCPSGLRFSVDTCVCERSQEVACEGCGPLVCEIELNKVRFKELNDFRRNGDCAAANKIVNDTVHNCIVKDPVARLLGIAQRISIQKTETQCDLPFVGEGCELLPSCFSLTVGPLEDGIAPKFLCENLKEVKKCFRCAERSGCWIAKSLQQIVRDAEAEICPNLQEFTCPADS